MLFKNTIFDLTKRTAMVTGASRGLGKAMAMALAEAGAHLVLCSRYLETLEESAQEIRHLFGVKVYPLVADLTVRTDAQQLASKALGLTGKIDILICNAGIDHPHCLEDLEDRTWDRDLELNLTSAMVLTRALAPQMKAQHWGRIIYISSVLGLASREGRTIYSATKAALIGISRSIALELGAHDVTVNCIAPGPFNTKEPYAVPSMRQKEEFQRWTALGRWGKPEEMAGPILLLATEAGSYITGSVIVVDGGALSKAF